MKELPNKTTIMAIYWYSWVLPLLDLFDISDSQPGPGAPCLCLDEIVSGDLYAPTAITHAGDGSGEIYVAEQRGYVWIYLQDGSRKAEPFLNITETDIYVTPDTGILNIAFHPNYVANGLFYVHYMVNDSSDNELYQRVSEFARSTSNPDVIDISTERILLTAFQYRGGHQGGGLLFGMDGYLYATFGDMNCCGDPNDQGQNKTTIQATTVRIDVNSRTGNLPYGIPPDNPFVGEEDTREEIFAFGFRNPYTASMDEGNRNTGEGRGRIFIGDVGSESVGWEEVDELFSGGNYGWPMYEGDTCLKPLRCGSIGPVEEPAVVYNRSLGSCVIFGGVYRGCMNPDLEGWMIFSDFVSTLIMGATEASPNNWEYEVMPLCEQCPVDLTNKFPTFIIAMGQDEAGEFYFGACDEVEPRNKTGSLYKLVDPNNPGSPCPIGP